MGLFKNDINEKMIFFGPASPLSPSITIFLAPSLHVTAKKAKNVSTERQTKNTIWYLYDAPNHKLDHKQMTEETHKQKYLGFNLLEQNNTKSTTAVDPNI